METTPNNLKPISSLISDGQNPKRLTTTANSESLPELSDTEKEEIIQEALLKAQQDKAKRLRDQQYWQRIHSPRTMTTDILGSWVLDEAKRYDEQGMNPRYLGESGFVLDENSRAVFDLLCMYFSNNPAFENAGKLYDQFAESKFSLKKGIALLGPTGCGKTTLLWLFCDNPRQSFMVTPCKMAVNTYKAAATTSEGNLIYDRFTGKSDVYGSLFRHGQGGRAFDDLGIETIPATLYKDSRNLMLDILERRYEIGPDGAGLTHLTTNLTPQQIEDLYGKRIRSRMREMFNLIKFDPKTPDRRE